MKTCIIIPCFNEFTRLPTLDFLSYIQNNEVCFLFVDDGSLDNTLILLQSIKEKFPNKVNILINKTNLGKAESVRLGVLKVLNFNTYDYIGFFDADLATPLSEISYFIKHLENNSEIDLIMGSRIKKLGNRIDRKFSRFLLGRIFATIISEFILKTPIYDTQCGAKIFKKEIALDMFKDQFITKWIFDVEFLLRLKNKYGKKYIQNNIYEFSLNTWEEKGNSKIKVIDFIKIPKDIINLKIKY